MCPPLLMTASILEGMLWIKAWQYFWSISIIQISLITSQRCFVDVGYFLATLSLKFSIGLRLGVLGTVSRPWEHFNSFILKVYRHHWPPLLCGKEHLREHAYWWTSICNRYLFFNETRKTSYESCIIWRSWMKHLDARRHEKSQDFFLKSHGKPAPKQRFCSVFDVGKCNLIFDLLLNKQKMISYFWWNCASLVVNGRVNRLTNKDFSELREFSNYPKFHWSAHTLFTAVMLTVTDCSKNT